jgi:hypothetical protein
MHLSLSFSDALFTMQPEIITFSHVGKCNTLLSQRRRNIIIMLEEDDEVAVVCQNCHEWGHKTRKVKRSARQVQSGDFLLGNDPSDS